MLPKLNKFELMLMVCVEFYSLKIWLLTKIYMHDKIIITSDGKEKSKPKDELNLTGGSGRRFLRCGLFGQ